MTKYTRSQFSFTLIITFTLFTFFTVISSAAPCGIQGHVEFFPEFNKDSLSGVITFIENKAGDKVVVDGIFTTDIGIDGIKTEDGNPRYTAELYDKKGRKLYDLTAPVFNNAIELVSFKNQYADLQICNKANDSIIGKVVIIKRDGEEIARAEIYQLL
jgi:hypothetical protein